MAERSVALVLATSTGGVGQHVLSLANYLVRDSFDVDILGPAATEEVFGFAATGARFTSVEITSRPRPADLRAIARLRRLTRHADLVHAHGLRAGALAALAGRRPLVVTWHNLVEGRAADVVGRIAARGATVTLGASADLVRRAAALGAGDARFGPVAAPPLPPPQRSRDEVRSELEVGDGQLVVAVGRLHPQKRFDVLIDAAARWLYRDAVVVIAGDGPERPELEAQIRRTAAPVRLLGRRTDVADLFAAADLAVLTSTWEARALVAQEAMRSGVPLVATAVGGMPELVEDGAVLVAPGNVDAFEIACRRLLDDPQAAAALGKRALEVSKHWPDEEESARQVAAVYGELLSGRVLP